MIDLPTVDFLLECFVLRDNGELIWKARPREHFPTFKAWRIWNGKWARKVAGTPHSRGYLQVTIGKRHFFAHRVIWALTTGAWPSAEIDHRNGDGRDNRPSNLREADRSQNLQNRRAHAMPGTSKTSAGRWQAQIKVSGHKQYLGVFATREEAYAAYLAAKKLQHPFQPEPRPA